MSKTGEEILAPKPEARPRIYAYAIDDSAHAGLLKVDQSIRDVKQRIAEQPQTASIRNYQKNAMPVRHGAGIAFLSGWFEARRHSASLHRQFCSAEAGRCQA
jgi:hypothetical protein